VVDRPAIDQAVTLIDGWLESLRGRGGYAGPVAHWWQSCLLYCGPMIDWRYEGIITGYLQLFRTTEDPRWLRRALAAAEDIRCAQLPDGRFRNSSFEIGPIEGGTPHEAAVCIGLLELARTLRAMNDPRWTCYRDVAERNIKHYQIAQLWDGAAFRDQAWNRTVVANKNATTLEALLLYEELGGESMERYIAGAAGLVLAAQVHAPGPRQGATIHLGTGRQRLAIGIYTARCAAALVRLYEQCGYERYIVAARAMGEYLLRLVGARGTTFGHYPRGDAILCPTWVSPSGDVLRALLALRPHADIPEAAIERLTGALIEHQLPSGGIQTARGLGKKGSTRQPDHTPDFRDVLPVAGWVDKAFRALTLLCDQPTPSACAGTQQTRQVCLWKGKRRVYHETPDEMCLINVGTSKPIFQWRKGADFPSVYRL
jgi:hypothetical protein